MNNKYKKGAFIITIVLLIIIFPLTIVSLVFHVKNNNVDNPNKEFYYDNQLYFYDTKGALLGKYECNYKKCGYAKQINNDDEYGIKYYKDDINYSNIIDNRFTFIADNKDKQTMIYLYDIKNNEVYANYKSYKNYGIGIVNNYYIVETLNGLYGVIKIDNDKVETILPFTYEYIALQDDLDLEQDKIAADSFIVKKDNKWFLTDKNGAEFTEKMDYPIVSFDATSFITKNEYYNLYNYNGNIKLDGNYTYLNYISKYIEVRETNNNYYLLENDSLNLKSNIYQLNENNVTSTNINFDDKIEIVIDNDIKEIIEIF